MSYDPWTEDYQRMSLRFAQTLDWSDTQTTAKAIADFKRLYTHNRNSLPQTDSERAFHLVAQAAYLIDYRLPFSEEKAAEKIIDTATSLLNEANALDDTCYDAQRMLAASQCPNFESYYRFLADHIEKVKQDCENARKKATGHTVLDEELAQDIAMRPYKRWTATLAVRALVCGRYRIAAKLVEELLNLDPQDASGARYTAALVYAKLEDDRALESLVIRTLRLGNPAHEDAWVLLARIALAYKRRDMQAAELFLQELMRSYPQAATTLKQQEELPDGVFCRLPVIPFSENELIVAVSEASVLLQEGRDDGEHGPLGNWLSKRAEDFLKSETT
ncbi:tetratricopeptide repeat protein [Atopobium fossor]|uniref:tetratricopeptide repeat protein n=1 Tax=Atopobium fossor TaxID=39487 RepID=UPI0003F971BF|nr:hypothetical protein [Atopobium fossor]